MKRFRTYATWSVAVIAILLSPIFLIFAIIAAVGIGLDIFDFACEGPVALALSVLAIFTLLRRGRRHAASAPSGALSIALAFTEARRASRASLPGP